METGIILAAAGGSVRFGSPKQLLSWRGVPLLRHMAALAVDAGLGPVAVVLGAAEDACRESLRDLSVQIAVNPAWEEGMGGSIAAGMRALQAAGLRSVIVMLCDQPGVTVDDLRALAKKLQETGADIVASEYANTLGSPAIFSACFFPRLLELSGKAGAKSLFGDRARVKSLPLPGGAFDIDTPGDLETLVQKQETA